MSPARMIISLGQREVELLHHKICAFWILTDKPALPPHQNSPLIHTLASNQDGHVPRFISQTPPYQIYRLSQTSPSLTSEAFTLLTSFSPWKFSLSLGIQENPHLRFCHYTFQAFVMNSSLCPAGPSLTTVLPKGEFPRGMV